MSSHTRFYNEDDEYEPSDSEDEYKDKEKQLLQKVRNRKFASSDSEDEVFGVGLNGDDDDDDDKSDLALSDVEGQDDDGLPDARAWGKDKRKYYSTDYVDPDYGGFQGKDAELAELEEQEARNLQKQLAEQLEDDDFSLDIFTKQTQENKKQMEEIIKTDISKLTSRQKLQLLEKESPEFFGLVEDFQVKMSIAKDYLYPVLEKYKHGKISKCKAIDFVQTQYTLILNYATNVYMYLLLKSSKVSVQSHPIIKRLYQYRQLLSQLDPFYNSVIKPQIDLILEIENLESAVEEAKPKKKKSLKLLASLVEKSNQIGKKKKRVTIIEGEKPSKKIKTDESHPKSVHEKSDDTVNIQQVNAVTDDSSSDEEAQEDEPQQTDKLTETAKRAITYEMAKNKGLTPYRKKEFRNPRVKHRLKYRKAVIRRKGAVREPRTELSRYSGEISGIKASVSKSIKIKT